MELREDLVDFVLSTHDAQDILPLCPLNVAESKQILLMFGLRLMVCIL